MKFEKPLPTQPAPEETTIAEIGANGGDGGDGGGGDMVGEA
jgi:hypothetical protein